MNFVNVEKIEHRWGRLLSEEELAELRNADAMICNAGVLNAACNALTKAVLESCEAPADKQGALRQDAEDAIVAALLVSSALARCFGIDRAYLEELRKSKPGEWPFLTAHLETLK